VWGREVSSLILTFHLAGINNQNFLMRDEETGSYWQQISGRCISGPLAGKALKLIPSDELTFALWRAERPDGKVLRDSPADASRYSAKDWDVRMKRSPTVLNFPEHGLGNRDLMLGIDALGEARAFPYEQVVREKLIRNRVGSESVILLVGPDGESVRAFRDQIPGVDAPPEFFRTLDDPGGQSTVLMDSATGSRWNFKGCAVEGKSRGKCLERVEVIKDYWFDWRNYHPGTTVYAGDRKR
jgi:hypothetical protein